MALVKLDSKGIINFQKYSLFCRKNNLHVKNRESKNYNEIVKDLIERKLKAHKFTKDDIEFRFEKLKKIEGEVIIDRLDSMKEPKYLEIGIFRFQIYEFSLQKLG